MSQVHIMATIIMHRLIIIHNVITLGYFKNEGSIITFKITTVFMVVRPSKMAAIEFKINSIQA